MTPGAGRPLKGHITVPGDKSISHRALILSALAAGGSTIDALNTGSDVLATATCLSRLGVQVEVRGDESKAIVEGSGWRGLGEATDVLDCGNSGTTIRSLLGLAAGARGMSVLTGDETLRRRPMLRVVDPLRSMGARIEGRSGGDRAPLVVWGGGLEGKDHHPEVASAQVKTSLLLAGLAAAGCTSVTEPAPSRDHTERMLGAAGVPVEVEGTRVSLAGGSPIAPVAWEVPGDVSSAAFLVAAAVLTPGSDLTIDGVGLNPTRTGVLEVLRRMGAEVEWAVEREVGGEPIGRIRARHSSLRGATVEGDLVPRLIDEVPVIAVLGAMAEGETVVRDAAELRVKESDRVATTVAGLRTLGVSAEERPDGLLVRGRGHLDGGRVESHGDHRIALAFAVAGSVARANVKVVGWSAVETSFPEFLDVMARARRRR